MLQFQTRNAKLKYIRSRQHMNTDPQSYPSVPQPESRAQNPALSAAEEVRLCMLARLGDDVARERLILDNLPLVRIIARTYEGQGLDYEDLVQWGAIGVVRAVDRHDPQRGTRLTTYAGVLIKQQIQRALDNHSRIVRLPGNVLEKLRLTNRIAASETAASGRPPTDAELAELTGNELGKIIELKSYNRIAVSMDQAFDDGDGGTLHDIVNDRVENTPGEEVESTDIAAVLHRMLEKLEIRERRILLARFGFYDGRVWTLEELSRVLCLTRERIRQIQNIALRRLRLAMVGSVPR